MTYEYSAFTVSADVSSRGWMTVVWDAYEKTQVSVGQCNRLTFSPQLY